MPGWIDNWHGPTITNFGTGVGAFRSAVAGPNLITDIVPIDMVTNVLIPVARQTAVTRPPELTVFNCGTSEQSPITWHEFVHKSKQCFIKNPLEKLVWYPSFTFRQSYVADAVHTFLMQSIPAYIFDSFERLAGKRPK